MGSQMVYDTKWGSVLGHPYNPDQIGVGYWTDVIASVALGTSTTKTKLGGTQVEGTSADYLLPTAARCIVAVRPKLVNTTPTATQPVLATLKVESGDLGIKDFEVLAAPVDAPTTSGSIGSTMFQDAAPWYPLMQPCNGGEKVQFYGTAQIANAVAPLMSCDVLLSDTWPQGYNGGWTPGSGYGPVQAKVAGINYGGGPTATGTGAGSVATDGGVTIAGPFRRLLGLFGVVVETTVAASKPISGWFSVNASELAINPQRWAAETIQGVLGATPPASNIAHISSAYPLNLIFRCPSTPKAQFNLDQAITTAGQFEVGYLYIDK